MHKYFNVKRDCHTKVKDVNDESKRIRQDLPMMGCEWNGSLDRDSFSISRQTENPQKVIMKGGGLVRAPFKQNKS